jgi:hypothetical protein
MGQIPRSLFQSHSPLLSLSQHALMNIAFIQNGMQKSKSRRKNRTTEASEAGLSSSEESDLQVRIHTRDQRIFHVITILLVERFPFTDQKRISA